MLIPGKEENFYNGRFVYVRDEYRFLFEGEFPQFPFSTSFTADTLQIEVGSFTPSEGIALHPWGFFCTEWCEMDQNLKEPSRRLGRIFVEHSLVRGVSWGIEKENEWKPFINPETGWIYYGLDPERGENIEFATNCVLSLHEGEALGIWMKPEMV